MDAHHGRALSRLRVNHRRLKISRQTNRRMELALDNMSGAAEWEAGEWDRLVSWSVPIAVPRFLIKQEYRHILSTVRTAEHK